MSETPRTDSAISAGYRFTNFDVDSIEVREYVKADFARQLERELAAANERAALLEGDRAWLDWLQKNTNWILCAETDPCGTFSIGRNDNFQNWALKVDSVRAAIDAALRANSAQKENKS